MEKGAASASADAGERDSNEGPGAALVSAAPRQAPTNPRRRISGTQQLVAHIFQNVGGAFDANFARENRILVLDAEDAFEANVHIGLDDGLPKAGAVTIADGAEGFRGQIEFVGFKGKIEDAELIEVLWKEDCVFHVGVENSALLAKEVDDFDGIAALPEEVAEVAVCADFFADGLAKFQQRARVIDDKVGMHFEGEALDAVFTRIFCLFLPERNHFFFPLPVLHLGIFGRPAVCDPVRLGVLGGAARAARIANDDFDTENFREQNGVAECFDVLLSVLWIGMKRIAVAAQSGDANPAVFEFYLPCFGLSAVGDELVERAMTIIRVAAGADLHGFETQSADLIKHGVEREMFIDGVENADRNLA